MDSARNLILGFLATAAAIVALIGESTTHLVTRWEEILTTAAVIIAAITAALKGGPPTNE